jgi:hypothetical protein
MFLVFIADLSPKEGVFYPFRSLKLKISKLGVKMPIKKFVGVLLLW